MTERGRMVSAGEKAELWRIAAHLLQSPSRLARQEASCCQPIVKGPTIEERPCAPGIAHVACTLVCGEPAHAYLSALTTASDSLASPGTAQSE
jgi:hypothetical protein